MLRFILSVISIIISLYASIDIPSIENAILIPSITWNSTVLYNMTCDECLCQTNPNDAVLNCLPNNTCQLFDTVPSRYRVRSMSQSRIFFPNRILPNKSQCCMPNFTEVMNKMYNGFVNSVSISTPRCLLLEQNGLILTNDYSPGYLRGYDPINLTPMLNVKVNFSNPFTLAQANDAYFIGTANHSILVIEKFNFTVLNIINSPYLNGIRAMTFLHGVDTMIVASRFTNCLVFFKRMNQTRDHYTFIFNLPVNYGNPHGLVYINDSFFYATSFDLNSVYSYTFINSTFWDEKLVIDARPCYNNTDGNHITIDECGRFWFALGAAGLLIFDEQGAFLTNYSQPSKYFFDASIDENHVLYISDLNSRCIMRIDPNIQC